MAEPTSTALLLSGQAALDMWPGLRRVGALGGRVLVEAPGPAEAPGIAAAAVLAHRPQRDAATFVTTFSWAGPGLPMTQGRLTLTPSPARRGRAATHAVLVLDAEALEDSRLGETDLTGMAEAFLATLAGRAEQRRLAA